jgi:putative flavoprotein involved in K+ transport
VTFRPRLVDASGHTVVFADGRSLDVRAVIWATGYKPDHSWLQIPDVVQDGRINHRRGVTTVPGLYFLGLAWQHTRGSALIGFVGHDAAYLAPHVRKDQAVATTRAPGATSHI